MTNSLINSRSIFFSWGMLNQIESRGEIGRVRIFHSQKFRREERLNANNRSRYYIFFPSRKYLRWLSFSARNISRRVTIPAGSRVTRAINDCRLISGIHVCSISFGRFYNIKYSSAITTTLNLRLSMRTFSTDAFPANAKCMKTGFCMYN